MSPWEIISRLLLGLSVAFVVALLCWQAPRAQAVYRGDAPVSALCSLSKVSPVVVYGEDLVGPSAIKTARAWAVRGAIAIVDDYDERLFALDAQAQSLKDAMRGREAKNLEAHIERMFEQRDDPQCATAPGVIGVIAARPSAGHMVRLRLAEGELSGFVHLTDLRQPNIEEKRAFESAVRRHEAELRRQEEIRVKLAYEKSKQTWREETELSRARRIAHAIKPPITRSFRLADAIAAAEAHAARQERAAKQEADTEHSLDITAPEPEAEEAGAPFTVGTLQESDRAQWEQLYRGYIAFYKRDEPQTFYDQNFARLLEDKSVHVLLARDGKDDSKLLGLAHFILHPSMSGDVCYLQDLFTDPEGRGKGVGTKLINAVVGWCRAKGGIGKVYWNTHEGNPAREKLYDVVGQHKGFVKYQVDV